VGVTVAIRASRALGATHIRALSLNAVLAAME
jgi:hypothetical protein